MALKIKNIEKESPGERMGISPGDRLVEINGHAINDVIDYQFYSADEALDCTFSKNGESLHIHFINEDGILGLDFETMRYRACGNRCIFCFVDQNPEGLRPSLYFKDEDYRLSFLHGNYVTLTHVRQRDLNRIVEQRLSPLYVSIHATAASIRKTLLGLDRDDHLMEKIQFLVQNGIQIHGQIVLCPGINDGDVLIESLETLSLLFPQLRSLAIVPVGLTCHRQLLPEISGFNAGTAETVVRMAQNLQKKYKKALGDPFVYISDEFYLLGEIPLPPFDHYGDFWQIENGVGMIRLFLREFHEASNHFPKKLGKPEHAIIVTGTLAGPVIQEHILPGLNRIENLHIELKMVVNHFYGDSVTVSGLLTGQDIIDSFQKLGPDTTLLLPTNCLNTDGLFLDNRTPNDLSERLGCRIRITPDFNDLWSCR